MFNIIYNPNNFGQKVQYKHYSLGKIPSDMRSIDFVFDSNRYWIDDPRKQVGLLKMEIGKYILNTSPRLSIYYREISAEHQTVVYAIKNWFYKYEYCGTERPGTTRLTISTDQIDLLNLRLSL